MKTLTLKYHNNPNIQAKLLARFLQSGAVIEFEALPEDINPYDDMEEIDADYVVKSYDSGNSYAWFCAKVTVTYKGFTADDYLGCCSYKSAADFKQDAYYIDMVKNCIDQINTDIATHNAGICTRFKMRNLIKIANELNCIVIPKTAALNI